jgi:hypothetical protein
MPGILLKRRIKQALRVPFTLSGRLENPLREQAPTHSLSLFRPETGPCVFYGLPQESDGLQVKICRVVSIHEPNPYSAQSLTVAVADNRDGNLAVR